MTLDPRESLHIICHTCQNNPIIIQLEVQKFTQSMAAGKGTPYKYKPTLPSEIGKHTSQCGAAVAAQHLSRKLEEQGDAF